jgi:tRNA-Thr(GGU) m(6)t(6)A37 methyltransferase TsaA
MTPIDAIQMTPIGVVHSPHRVKADAPRQPAAAIGTPGVIELFTGHQYEDALADLDEWDRIWVLFWFDRAHGWRPKVRPPRSDRKRGVFSTRAPHRPNAIGMSALRLVRVEGTRLDVVDVDILDGTPVLDIKPYVPYADAFPEAGHGWIGGAPDPGPQYEVVFEPGARRALDFLVARGVDLEAPLVRALSLGPTPHAYRRIRREGDGYRIAVREWRASFLIEAQRVHVTRIDSGYGLRALAGSDPTLAVHRELVAARLD